MIITRNDTCLLVKQKPFVLPVHAVFRKVTISPKKNLLENDCLERAEACFPLER